MRYTEAELKAMSYPINDKEKEHCLEILDLVKSLCLKLKYQLVGEITGGQIAADYAYRLQLAGESLTLKIIGGHAENTLGKQNVSVKVAVLASCRDAAINLREALYMSLLAYGAEVSGTCFLNVNLSREVGNFRLMFGYGTTQEEVYFLRENGNDNLRYLYKDSCELQRKNLATDYSFKKFLRIIKTIGPELQQQSAVAKGICYVKVTHILSNLPDGEYIRFDNLEERLRYIVLRICFLLEKNHCLKECNGIKALFENEDEQKHYLAFFEALRSWLA